MGLNKLFTSILSFAVFIHRRCHTTFNALFAFTLLQCSFQISADIITDNHARVAIIIDDLGNNIDSAQAALDLQGDITYAVLPFTPYGSRVATEAFSTGREVILHTPMANQSGAPLGAGGLTLDMSQDEFKRTFNSALDSIPYITGINNHMGSLLTQHTEPMLWVMEELRRRDMIFIDSLTSPISVARKTAIHSGVPSLSRDIFLDHDQSEEAIDKAFRKMMRIARWQGFAVAIGHPYENTLSYLHNNLGLLKENDIHLISISKMFSHPTPDKWFRIAIVKTVIQLPSPDPNSEQFVY